MRSKFLGLILLSGNIFFPVESLFSQSNNSISLVHPNIVPVTPEAAAMERYVNYPVSYSTGIPDINIPLYEIKVGDITLPISLSYHAAGLKPHEYSGWAGTGWTLNAEPSVMRNIEGIPDDEEPKKGYNFHNHKDYELFANTSSGKKNMRDMIDLKKYDENPDRFTFKLADESGNFYLSENKGLIIHPAQDIEISKGYASRKDFPDFTVTNKRGIKYFFGGEENYYERTGDYITRWMCKEISSPVTKAKISFEYNSCRRDISSNIPNHYIIIEDQISNATVAYLTDFRDGSHYRYTISENNTLTYLSRGTNYQTAPRPYTSNALSEKKPSAIRFDNGSVIFEAYSCRQLYTMTVKDKDENIVRTIEFFISPYNSGTALTKLDSVYIHATGCETRVYKFTYHDPDGVPRIGVQTIDHWGFYNGRSTMGNRTSETMVPTISAEILTSAIMGGTPKKFSFKYDGANRESDESSAKVGILTSITDSQGTKTEFTYEGNKTGINIYDGCTCDTCCTDIPVGGLRIKRIIVRDMISSEVSFRNFTYSYNFFKKDWGVPKSKYMLTSNDYAYTQYKRTYTNNNGFHSDSRLRIWYSMPISGITYNNGSAVLYEKVTESIHSSKGTGTQKNIYHYNNLFLPQYGWCGGGKSDPKYCNVRPVAEHPYDKDDQGDYRKGLLSKVENYANDSLVAQTEYEYAHAENSTKRIRIAKPYRQRTVEFNRPVPNEDDFINSNDNEIYVREPWYLDTGWMNLTKETARTFFPGGKEVTTTREYTYTEKYEWGLDIGIDGNEEVEIRDCWYPIKIKTYGSTGTPIYDRYLYSGTPYALAYYDIPYIHFYPEDLVGDTYIRDDIIEHRRIIGTDTTYVRKKYKGMYPELIKTKSKPGPDFDVRLRYHQYDNYGNVADVSDAEDKHTCYIWSYNNQYPIARFEGISYGALLQYLNKDATWIKDLGNKNIPAESDFQLLNNLSVSNVLSYIYTYKPLLGLATSIREPNGFTTFYEYDNFGRMKKAYRKENGQTKLLEENDYYLVSRGGESASQYPLLNTWFNDNIYGSILKAGNTEFEILIEGGSGNFSYLWTLENLDGNIYETKNTQNSWVTVKLIYIEDKTKAKINRLRCKVKDNKTLSEKEAVVWFYVDK
jgi:YD repeat-containing protein